MEVLREALGDSLEFSSNGKLVSVASLSPKLRLLMTIMFHSLYPLSNTGYMNLGRALFLHDLIADEEIDVAIIFSTSWQKQLNGLLQGTVFPFAALSQRS